MAYAIPRPFTDISVPEEVRQHRLAAYSEDTIAGQLKDADETFSLRHSSTSYDIPQDKRFRYTSLRYSIVAVTHTSSHAVIIIE